MPVNTKHAEEYELPEINESPGSVLQDEEDVERERLLDPRTSEDKIDGEDAEQIGKGTKIDDLIARTVPSTDDTTLPTLTLRVLLLGSMFCIMGASASQVFYFKSNAPTFSSYFVILVTYPLGHLLANERVVKRGTRFMGFELNPGKFSIKEAILVSVIFTSGSSSAYATDILAIMDLYFKMPLSTIPSIILLLTTQCVGFGLAGMLQNLLVSVPSMYWPSVLVTVQLFTTLYPTPETSSGRSTAQRQVVTKRFRVFLLVFIATFVYQFFPMLLFPTLTSIATLCLINNQSWWMRTMGSGYNGAGMFNLSLDWSSIGASGPLYTPYWALGNYFGGLIAICWIIAPIMFMTNFWDARSFPRPMSSGLYSTTFEKFDVTSVLNADLSLNETAWETAGPMLLTPYFAISYALSFAALSSILVHVYLWHWEEIKEALSSRRKLDDIHNTLMRSYLPVPSSWYLGMLGINFVAAILLVTTTPLQMPVWALVLSIAIAAVFLVPCGIITAVSNTTIGLNVLTEFVAGVLMPGKPIGNVTFKCYGYMAMSQALELTSDLKLGWYTSIPPRQMFACQVLGAVIGALTNYITLVSVIASKRPFLDGTTPDPTGQWTGRSPSIFYSASIIWGAVAPARFFSGKYTWLYMGFILGAIVPLVGYWAHKKWPGRKINKFVFPIVCSGATMVPQYPTNIILTGAMTAVLANSYIAKRYPKVHSQYIYVISSGLDAGTSITALTIYLLFGLLTSWDGPNWWGNSRIDTEHCVPGS